MSMTEGKAGEPICLEFYDGPLTEIVLITFDDSPPLVELQTYLVAEIKGEPPWQHVRVRLDRDEIQAMLDMIDGKHVKGFFNK